MDFHFLVMEKSWKINVGKEGHPIQMPGCSCACCRFARPRVITVAVVHACHDELLLFCSEHGRHKVVRCSAIPCVCHWQSGGTCNCTVLKLPNAVRLPNIVQTAAAQCVCTLISKRCFFKLTSYTVCPMSYACWIAKCWKETLKE